MAKHRGRCVTRVTRIRARSGITAHQRLSHSPLDTPHACRVGNGTSPTTITHGLEFSIPVCKRHPHFNLDIRIAPERQTSVAERIFSMRANALAKIKDTEPQP